MSSCPLPDLEFENLFKHLRSLVLYSISEIDDNSLILPFQSALRFRRPDLATEIREVATRRYTMADIGVLDDRIRTLEYYTSLSLLESKARQFDVKDDTGLARFKNGFFVENFDGHNLSDSTKRGYRASIDRNKNQ